MSSGAIWKTCRRINSLVALSPNTPGACQLPGLRIGRNQIGTLSIGGNNGVAQDWEKSCQG